MNQVPPVIAALLALVATLSPLAVGHVADTDSRLQGVHADTVLSVDILTEFPEAEQDLPLHVEIVNFTTARHPENATPPRLSLQPSGGGAAFLPGIAEESPGHYRGSVRFPVAGAWSVTVEHEATGARATIPFIVYPASPYRFEWSPAADVHFIALEPARLAFLVVNDTGEAHPAPPEGVVRMERWTHDWSHRFSETTVSLTPTGAPGEIAVEYRFNEPGLYALHVGVPALGLAAGDRPLFQIYVFPPEAPTLDVVLQSEPEAKARTPAAGLPHLVLAMALALVLSRRHRRE
ncbi:MAG TPA: hypothetical protein VNZ52_00120 [Candidatus Thermoplasmatota archaeon]|nr:hypothetical protein [Candidatus Thermoplasmatota archaeon]